MRRPKVGTAHGHVMQSLRNRVDVESRFGQRRERHVQLAEPFVVHGFAVAVAEFLGDRAIDDGQQRRIVFCDHDSVRQVGQRAAGDAKNPAEFRITGRPLSYLPYGIMVAKNNSTLLAIINRTIAEKFRNGDGKTMYDKWFGQLNMPLSPLTKAAFDINAIPE